LPLVQPDTSNSRAVIQAVRIVAENAEFAHQGTGHRTHQRPLSVLDLRALHLHRLERIVHIPLPPTPAVLDPYPIATAVVAAMAAKQRIEITGYQTAVAAGSAFHSGISFTDRVENVGSAASMAAGGAIALNFEQVVFDPRQQYLLAHWLVQHFVAAGLQADADVFTAVTRGEEQNRQARFRKGLAQPAADFEARHARHHHIENYQI